MLLTATKDSPLDWSLKANSDCYPEQLNQLDYPMVKFWRYQDWKEHTAKEEEDGDKKSNPKGSVQASRGINVAMLYIEDDQGEPISGRQATDIRAVAYRIFQELMERNLAPTAVIRPKRRSR